MKRYTQLWQTWWSEPLVFKSWLADRVMHSGGFEVYELDGLGLEKSMLSPGLSSMPCRG